MHEFQEKPTHPVCIPGDPARCFASMGNYLFLVMMAFMGFGVLRSLFIWVRSATSHVDKDTDQEAEVSSIDI